MTTLFLSNGTFASPEIHRGSGAVAQIIGQVYLSIFLVVMVQAVTKQTVRSHHVTCFTLPDNQLYVRRRSGWTCFLSLLLKNDGDYFEMWTQSDQQQGLFADLDGNRRDIGCVQADEAVVYWTVTLLINHWMLKIKVLKGLDCCNLF